MGVAKRFFLENLITGTNDVQELITTHVLTYSLLAEHEIFLCY